VQAGEPKRFRSLKGFKTLNTATILRPFRTAGARRAIEEIDKDRRGWIRHGIAALAISGLGLGVAGAVALTGSASQSSPGAAPGVTVASSPAAQQGETYGAPRAAEGVSRSVQRQALNEDGSEHAGQPLDGTHDLTHLRDAQKNLEVTDTSTQNADAAKAAKKRAEALASASSETQQLSEKLSREERERRQALIKQAAESAQSQGTGTGAGAAGTAPETPGDTGADTPVTASPGDGKARMPLNSYSIAATFGQVGSWSRYHTGVDFSAPIGTPIYATGNGVVTNAGGGSASSWAGNYVTIKFADGQQMLFAHMGTVSVSQGQQVAGGTVIGHVGMTGRTFGPHCHVELYPAGVTPGDVYRAVDPMRWFSAHGLR
jgi:murein DD-endopeptidase MepM/ murein hydrolase activator NlpD